MNMIKVFLTLLWTLTPNVKGFTTSSATKSHVEAPIKSTVLFVATTTDGEDSSSTKGFSFQYSESSLKHLEAVEFPADYSRPWTKEKVKAMSGAFASGGLCTFLGEYAGNELLDIEKVGIVLGAVGAAAGWYLLGGGDVMEAEKPKNGGYDAKLVADKPSRLKSILDAADLNGIHVEETAVSGRDLTLALKYIRLVHDDEYINMVKTKSESTDRPIRMNPLLARTLIDQYTYDAAVNAAADWIESIDAALEESPTFALVRPPSHHTCQSKAMGGCFFNSVAIAAMYALDHCGLESVAILDIDAHHGNGIAHCVQNDPRIKFCSIHELKGVTGYMIEQKIDEDDPRSPSEDDNGPLGNICNIRLNPGTGWDNGYKNALVSKALPFLQEGNANILIVAAGFDAMDTDRTSQLNLKPEHYEKVGKAIYDCFGKRVAFGLEGGYSAEDGGLSRAILSFVKPWQYT